MFPHCYFLFFFLPFPGRFNRRYLNSPFHVLFLALYSHSVGFPPFSPLYLFSLLVPSYFSFFSFSLLFFSRNFFLYFIAKPMYLPSSVHLFNPGVDRAFPVSRRLALGTREQARLFGPPFPLFDTQAGCTRRLASRHLPSNPSQAPRIKFYWRTWIFFIYSSVIPLTLPSVY